MATKDITKFLSRAAPLISVVSTAEKIDQEEYPLYVLIPEERFVERIRGNLTKIVALLAAETICDQLFLCGKL